MNKTLKYGFGIFGAIIVFILGFITFGLYLMQIEDSYGDYQEIYYKSKDLDIIVNEGTSEFGIIEKDWKQLNVKVNKHRVIDLNAFVFKVNAITKIKVYRPKEEFDNLEQMNWRDLQKLISEKKLELIF
ncbi:hypothetical protein [Aquimarina agarivorans]|uniref:hypothetical protein n=1 Tax=Aquimarina agarivorans TaxID=980584 RepID=UPI000248EBAA|nr:hypothetical protein [Aquimarina agarivorans]